MNTEEAERIAQSAAEQAIEKFTEAHPCLLSERERSRVHAIDEVLTEEGADNGTLRVIVQYGKGAQDVTKTIRRAGVAVLFLIILIVALAMGPDLFAKCSRIIK